MANSVLASLEANALTNGEIERLRAFINQNDYATFTPFLRAILIAAEGGRSIDVLADDTEVSPNEAARLLKMSRPHLLKFMRDGQLPYHMVGSHQRIKMSDLKTFIRSREAGAEAVANAVHATPSIACADELTQAELEELDRL